MGEENDTKNKTNELLGNAHQPINIVCLLPCIVFQDGTKRPKTVNDSVDDDEMGLITRHI